jgi:DNA-binding response OmpR family regulator
MIRVLVVEDNPDLAAGLRNNLEIEGYRVETASDGQAGLAAAQRHLPDLVVLDLMLPGLDGFHVLRRLRAEHPALPVLVLTARGEEADKVRGLRLGADDYVTKPFGLLELLARIEALLRRSRPPEAAPAGELLRFGEVELEPAAREVRRAGVAVELAPKEYDLLLALARARGSVVTRLRLVTEVWGYSGTVVTRTVDTHVAELRRKLEPDPAHPRHLLTVRKVGYRLKLD